MGLPISDLRPFLIRERIKSIYTYGTNGIEEIGAIPFTNEQDIAECDLILHSDHKTVSIGKDKTSWIFAPIQAKLGSLALTIKNENATFGLWFMGDKKKEIKKPLICCVLFPDHTEEHIRSLQNQTYPSELISYYHLQSEVKDYAEDLQKLNNLTEASYLLLFHGEVILHPEALEKMISLMEKGDYDLMSPALNGSQHYEISGNSKVLNIHPLVKCSNNVVLRVRKSYPCFFGPSDYMTNLINSVERKVFSNLFSYGTVDKTDLKDENPFNDVVFFSMNPPPKFTSKDIFTKQIFNQKEMTNIKEQHRNNTIANNKTNSWIYKRIAETVVEANKTYRYELTRFKNELSFNNLNVPQDCKLIICIRADCEESSISSFDINLKIGDVAVYPTYLEPKLNGKTFMFIHI